MPVRRRPTLLGAALAIVLCASVGASAGAAGSPAGPPSTAAVSGAIGEGASDVNAFFSGTIKGIVHAAVLSDGSVRVRSVVRGGSTDARYRVIGAATPCGQAATGTVRLIRDARIMGTLHSHTFPAGALPDRADLFASLRIVRVGGGQVACSGALSYEPVPSVAGPALVLKDVMISSFMSPDRPRGLLVTTGPDSTEPQLRWSFTGLADVPSYRIVGSTAPCGTAATPASEVFRSSLQTRPYGFTEVTGLDLQAESFRILAKSGKQLACTGRGRHVQPLL